MKTALTTTFAALLLGLTLASAKAQTILTRTDSKAGSNPSTSVAYLGSQAEFWAYSPNTPYADYEVGKLTQVKTGKKLFVLAGGYGVWWPTGNKFFIAPFILAKTKIGSLKIAGNLGTYVPLNGGPKILFSDETSAMLPVQKKVEVGVAGSFWLQSGSTVYRFGPKVSADLGGGYGVSVRYLRGPGAPDSARLTLSHSW